MTEGLWFDVGRRVRRIDSEQATETTREGVVLDTWKEDDRWAGRHLIRGRHWARLAYDDQSEGIVALAKLAPLE